ncbi:hypothetical protein OPV22_020020 [Ensete ventricosum]|uniref:Uncharacterized protein n=1 Tax=Ensete ventricosum TaxID=4639 RepID=A0AAV8QP30_ENSVE|nr:hypothetical protein OPV22_020020 [Ensete ventricosum]
MYFSPKYAGERIIEFPTKDQTNLLSYYDAQPHPDLISCGLQQTQIYLVLVLVLVDEAKCVYEPWRHVQGRSTGSDEHCVHFRVSLTLPLISDFASHACVALG